jgi:hypothetical protein
MRKLYRLNTKDDEIVEPLFIKKLADFYEIHQQILCRKSEFNLCSNNREKFGLTRSQN